MTNTVGKAHVFSDNINTDDVIAGKYKHTSIDPAILVKHIMENIRPNFYEKISKGDFIVAGENFGCGSSREQAPSIIKEAGITAVIAKSFSRLFYRNSLNIGLTLITFDTSIINENDRIYYDAENRKIYINSDVFSLKSHKLPESLEAINSNDGLINYIKKYGQFKR